MQALLNPSFPLKCQFIIQKRNHCPLWMKTTMQLVRRQLTTLLLTEYHVLVSICITKYYVLVY